jgi:hypothetical protein
MMPSVRISASRPFFVLRHASGSCSGLSKTQNCTIRPCAWSAARAMSMSCQTVGTNPIGSPLLSSTKCLVPVNMNQRTQFISAMDAALSHGSMFAYHCAELTPLV